MSENIDPAVCANGNTRILRLFWHGIFTFAAILELTLWPETENIYSVLLAWAACTLTGVFVLREGITYRFPCSSFLLLYFCLTTTGLPLILLLLQGDPLTQNLEVPYWTYFHLFLCQCVLLFVHLVYRRTPLSFQSKRIIQRAILGPLGILKIPSRFEIVVLGSVGLIASFYVYIVVRDTLGGQLAVTGSPIDKIAQALCPFVYAPFLLLFPNFTGSQEKPKLSSIIYALIHGLAILIVAIAWNGRSFIFIAVATALIALALATLAGLQRIRFGGPTIFAIVLLFFGIIGGSEISVAMRVARAERSQNSAADMIQRTLSLLTTNRSELSVLRESIRKGKDGADAWYVKDPVLSRVIYTHYQDKALSIANGLSEESKSALRKAHIERLWATLPNPLLRFFNVKIDKETVQGCSMGDWMDYLGGRKGRETFGGYFTSGFPGDGYGAYGWMYLLGYGGIALVVFIFADSVFFNSSEGGLAANGPSYFVFLGLIFSYSFSLVLQNESIIGMISFLVRHPFQWLLFYSIIIFVGRFVSSIFAPQHAD